MKKNDLIKLKINDVTIEGSGVGRFENIAVFVPGSAIGDELEVKIIKLTKNYAVGKIEKIIVASEDRISPDCKCYSRCGGCSFRHISYEAELKIKHKHVSDCLARIGGFKDINVNNIIPAENLNFYRNKSQMPVGIIDGEVVAGFFSPHSHRIINCENCLLQPEEFSLIISEIKKWVKSKSISVYDEKSGSGFLRHIYLRYAEFSDEIMLCLVINGENMPYEKEFENFIISKFANIKSIVLNVNKEKTNVILGRKSKVIWGKNYITDSLCGFRFNISADSFYQVNRRQTEKLYSLVKDGLDLKGGSEILDLYCGIGTIGITLSPCVSKLIGVEVVNQAVENARENAKINNIENAEFICADASFIEEKLKKSPDAVIIDPPRKGCKPDLIKSIIKMNPKKIAYVSCNPATLARDLKILTENLDFEVNSVTPVDMFPRTSHVETVAVCRKPHDSCVVQ